VAADREETLPERGPNLFGQILTGCLEKLAAKASSCDPAAAAALTDEAVACQHVIDGWERTRPSDDERSEMRARLADLGARIAKL
jgi:hypothetical protein